MVSWGKSRSNWQLMSLSQSCIYIGIELLGQLKILHSKGIVCFMVDTFNLKYLLGMCLRYLEDKNTHDYWGLSENSVCRVVSEFFKDIRWKASRNQVLSANLIRHISISFAKSDTKYGLIGLDQTKKLIAFLLHCIACVLWFWIMLLSNSDIRHWRSEVSKKRFSLLILVH